MPEVAPLTGDEIDLIRAYHLSLGQIKWRRAKQRQLRERFRGEYPEDDVTCFLTTGRCCFDTAALIRAQQAIAAGPRPQAMSMIRWGDKPNARELSVAPATLLVWVEPQKGRHYVVGADIGEGLAGGDASCACVLDRESGEQVAELHGRVSPDRFGHLLDALGRWYHLAELAVERNNHGHSTLNTLRNTCRYPWLYHHVRYDVMTRTATPMLGWPTDAATKPILVDDLAAAIEGGHLGMHSSDLVGECLTFVTDDGGSQGAQSAKFDDRVMAAGIAWQVRKRPRSKPITERPRGW